MSDTLTPQYLDIDFATLKDQLKTQLSESTIFRDYDYEGANITILIELVSYLGALTTYAIDNAVSRAANPRIHHLRRQITGRNFRSSTSEADLIELGDSTTYTILSSRSPN